MLIVWIAIERCWHFMYFISLRMPKRIHNSCG